MTAYCVCDTFVNIPLALEVLLWEITNSPKPCQPYPQFSNLSASHLPVKAIKSVQGEMVKISRRQNICNVSFKNNYIMTSNIYYHSLLAPQH